MKSVCRCYSFEAQDQGVCSAWDFSHFCCIKENFLHGYLRSFQVLLKIISKQIKWELIKCQPFTSENYLFSWNQSIQHASKSFPNAPCTTASVNCSVVHHWVRNLALRSHGGQQAAVVAYDVVNREGAVLSGSWWLLHTPLSVTPLPILLGFRLLP